MSTLDHILNELSNKYGFTQDDLDIIREAMVKYAVAATLDNKVAAEALLYHEKE